MAMRIGVRVRGMDRFYGHVQSRDALNNELLWPHPVVDATLTAGIAVDASGKRFADEGLGGIYFANAIAQQWCPPCRTSNRAAAWKSTRSWATP